MVLTTASALALAADALGAPGALHANPAACTRQGTLAQRVRV